MQVVCELLIEAVPEHGASMNKIVAVYNGVTNTLSK